MFFQQQKKYCPRCLFYNVVWRLLLLRDFWGFFFFTNLCPLISKYPLKTSMVMTSMLESLRSAETGFQHKQMAILDSFGPVRSISSEVKGDRRLTAWFVLGHTHKKNTHYLSCVTEESESTYGGPQSHVSLSISCHYEALRRIHQTFTMI